MSKHKFLYCLEMRANDPRREVSADSYEERGDWLVFFRAPPEGGKREYWRVRLDAVVSMETRHG